MKLKGIIVFRVIAVSIAVGVIYWYAERHERLRRVQQINDVALACQMYAEKHGGQFPCDLRDLSEIYRNAQPYFTRVLAELELLTPCGSTNDAPNTRLFRERKIDKYRQRLYSYVDGHCEGLSVDCLPGRNCEQAPANKADTFSVASCMLTAVYISDHVLNIEFIGGRWTSTSKSAVFADTDRHGLVIVRAKESDSASWKALCDTTHQLLDKQVSITILTRGEWDMKGGIPIFATPPAEVSIIAIANVQTNTDTAKVMTRDEVIQVAQRYVHKTLPDYKIVDQPTDVKFEPHDSGPNWTGPAWEVDFEVRREGGHPQVDRLWIKPDGAIVGDILM